MASKKSVENIRSKLTIGDGHSKDQIINEL